jgi:hypothetical protein
MNTYAALVILNGYIAGARRTARERRGPEPSAGSITLEQVIITLGLIAAAALLAAAIAVAVQRRVNQIN